jgi:hypothetical protein
MISSYISVKLSDKTQFKFKFILNKYLFQSFSYRILKYKNCIMFFTEEQIKKATECSMCKETFVDPRFLPCGECICNKCVLASNNKNEFHCFSCNENHLIPRAGFPICKSMLNLLKEKPKGAFKFDALDKLNVEMKSMKESLDNLSFEVHQSKELLRYKCEVTITQIEIKTESVIQQIEKSREELLKQVDEYQRKCEEYIKAKNGRLTTIIDKSSKCYQDYDDYIKKQNIVQCDIIKMTNEAIETKIALKNEKAKLNTILKKGDMITFQESKHHFDTRTIGSLTCVPIDRPATPIPPFGINELPKTASNPTNSSNISNTSNNLNTDKYIPPPMARSSNSASVPTTYLSNNNNNNLTTKKYSSPSVNRNSKSYPAPRTNSFNNLNTTFDDELWQREENNHSDDW